jgi:hypothetical protein
MRTYDVGGGKQKTAFGAGTIYFRHGAKSEHGNNHDLRTVVERELNTVRKAWVKGLRQVVQAPIDSEIVAVPRTTAPATKVVRAVKDLAAQPILLTRDSAKAGAIFYHEEISEGIFDEINNVIDANKALAKGQKRFHLGQGIYHRVYAERQHVVQERDGLELLLRAAISQFHAPGLFWMLRLPDESIVAPFLDLYRNPRSPQVFFLPRIATILGKDFSDWLLRKLNKKFDKSTQPPGFYWSFKRMSARLDSAEYRLRAAHLSTKWRPTLPIAENISVTELLDDPSRAAALVSVASMVAFEHESAESRSIARNLDYLAYGAEIRKRARGISEAIMQAVGTEQVGEFIDNSTVEE